MRSPLLGLAAISIAALGCTPDLPRCEVDGQCPAGQVCRVDDGVCVFPDAESRDAGDEDPADAGAPRDAGAPDGGPPLDDGRPDDAGPGAPFDSGPSDPPVDDGRDPGEP